MARVSKQFSEDFELVTTTWVKRGDHTPEEIKMLRDRLRVELSPGLGLPTPVINGQPVKGWRPLTHDERVQCYSDTFADWADAIRRDQARAERIRAEVRAERERKAA
jgi:hypothetical protein